MDTHPTGLALSDTGVGLVTSSVSQRLIMAQDMLERTDRGIEQVAVSCGLTPLMLRRHFARRSGITPQPYR